MSFNDHFSTRSELYARHRPAYPAALFKYIAGLCERQDRAWDCATGNGQAAVALSHYFEHVVATDASADQVAAAISQAGVSYAQARAEDSGLSAASVDLITVGQALHWFEHERFFAEARRVVVPGGILAAWCYERCCVDRDCDAVINELFSAILDGFWPAERHLIEEGYRSIRMPGIEIPAPAFDMRLDWRVDDMLGYLRTWSACNRYQAQHGEDPVAIIETQLACVWGGIVRSVRWPLTLRVCRL